MVLSETVRSAYGPSLDAAERVWSFLRRCGARLSVCPFSCLSVCVPCWLSVWLAGLLWFGLGLVLSLRVFV